MRYNVRNRYGRFTKVRYAVRNSAGRFTRSCNRDVRGRFVTATSGAKNYRHSLRDALGRFRKAYRHAHKDSFGRFASYNYRHSLRDSVTGRFVPRDAASHSSFHSSEWDQWVAEVEEVVAEILASLKKAAETPDEDVLVVIPVVI